MNKIIGAAIEVHRHLGPGFLEATYHSAMCIELEERGMSFKAVSQLEEIHGAQLVSYLKATGLRAGMLMNFNKPVLKAGLRRIVV